MQNIRLILRMGVVIVSLLNITACASTGGYISGQVLDAKTREPISDAHVVIIWNGGEFAVVERQTICVYADGTLTDAEGKFSFLPWVKPDGLFPISDIQNHIAVYKPRYEEVNPKRRAQGDRTYVLKAYVGSREDHLEYLHQVPRRASCRSGGSYKKNLFPLYEALYYEAKSLSLSDEEEKELGWFRRLAAKKAIAAKGQKDMSSTEQDKLIEDYLMDNLQ